METPNSSNEVLEQWKRNWGNDLLRDYPKGLGNPDFENNGNERFIWSAIGFVAFRQLNVALGVFRAVEIDGAQYETFPEEKREQLKIANYTHKYAQPIWSQSKAEAERQAAQLESQRQIERNREKSAVEFEGEILRVKSIKALEFKANELSDSLSVAMGKDGELRHSWPHLPE